FRHTRSHSHCCPRFFIDAPATTEIYTLSLHDALPISPRDIATAAASACGLHNFNIGWCPSLKRDGYKACRTHAVLCRSAEGGRRDRKSTRLNSSHVKISYAVFCLKKKKKQRMYDGCKH